jgi:hypothetical protein
MDGGNRLSVRIEQQDWQTIGSAHGNCKTGLVCDQSVAFLLAVAKAARIPDSRGMDLPQSEVRRRRDKAGSEAMLLPGKIFKRSTAVQTPAVQLKKLCHQR